MKHGAGREKVRIVVAFGDLVGFSRYYEEITSDEEQLYPLLDSMDDIIDHAEEKSGYYFADTGDGFMCIVVLGKGHACKKVAEVLRLMWSILQQINALLDSMDHPKPAGFRIRLSSGYVDRKVKKNGGIIWRGKHLNLTHNLLEIARNAEIICHDSVKNLMSEAKFESMGFVFRKIGPIPRRPRSVTADDVSRLWTFRIDAKK